MPSVHCPKCGSTAICERNIALADIRVTGWELDEHGEPEPTGFRTEDADAEWFTEDRDDPYTCIGCHEWNGMASELIVIPDPDDDDDGFKMPDVSVTASQHRLADAKCGRDWVCQCAACRTVREKA